MFYLFYCLYLVLTTVGLVLMKQGGTGLSLTHESDFFEFRFNILLILGILCYGVSFILYFYIIQKRDLRFIYQISAGLLNIFVVVAGNIFLHETLSPIGIAGTLVVVIGIVLMNIGK